MTAPGFSSAMVSKRGAELLYSYSRGFMSQPGPSFVPAQSFPLLFGPEKIFQVMGCCCFQSPREDGDVLPMPSCAIHITARCQEEKSLMRPLAGPYHEFLSRGLCCYLRNNPATSPQKKQLCGPSTSLCKARFPRLFYVRFCCLHSFLHKSKPKKLLKKICYLPQLSS